MDLGENKKSVLQDLATKGFVVIPGYLSAAECDLFLADFTRSSARLAENQNYNVFGVSPPTVARMNGKLDSTCKAISQVTNIQVDLATASFYFSVERGISFGWHQDHESYFLFQDHLNYLNFYIPIVKPDPNKSNLSIIPFDWLLERAPTAARCFVGKGATTFVTNSADTLVIDDETDLQSSLPFNLDELAYTPSLNAGDLLLLRGDVIHKTQDTSTPRIAVSLRRQSSRSTISKSIFMAGGERKKDMMSKNPEDYETMLRYFSEAKADYLTVGQYVQKRREEFLSTLSKA